MKPSSPFTTVRACLVSLWLVLPAACQNESLEGLLAASRTAMEAEDWPQALALSDQAVERFGKQNPLKTYGPQFGAVYYRKGLSEMKLKKWMEAIRSFETCYREFPNKSQTARDNPFEKMALLKWGESAMGAEIWELAASRFHKFIEERDKLRDSFPQGAFYINFAICNYKLRRIAEGNENLEVAIRNKLNFPTPDVGIMAGFQELVIVAIDEKNEQVLLDFIGKNRGELTLEPYEMHRYSGVFMKLAGDALAAGMQRAALAMYQLVPSTDMAINDVRARLKAMAGADRLQDGETAYSRQELERDLAALEAEQKSSTPPEAIKLAAVAVIHEANGNITGAFAAYQQLELYFSGAEKREDYLFNLVRLSSRVGYLTSAREYGERFLADFPKSPNLSAVRQLILSSVHEGGDVETSIAVAGRMHESSAAGSSEHDQSLHILGVSHYRAGLHQKAQPLLDRHVELYPKSEFAIPAAFFRASNAVRLQAWKQAAVMLDSFLTSHSNPQSNPYLPDAMYERAACHFAEGQFPEALRKCDEVINRFSASKVIGEVYSLKGNAEHALGKSEDALKSYQKALELVNRAAAGPVLLSLVKLSPAKAAASFADRYWKEHESPSQQAREMAVAQVEPLAAVGRMDEALRKLRALIAEDPEVGGDDDLIRAYTTAYLKNHSAEELRQHFREFTGNPRVLRVLGIQVIEAFEKLSKAGESGKVATATLKVLYRDFMKGIVPEDISNKALIMLGDHLRLHTSTPREALVYYDEVIRREDPAGRFAALLGKADVYTRSPSSAEADSAVEAFSRVLAGSGDPGEREYAHFRLIEALMVKGEFAKATALAGSYLDVAASKFTAFVPQVKLLLAKCHHAEGRTDTAILQYSQIGSAYRELIMVSAPAMLEWMKLCWERNRAPSDRRTALETAVSYMKFTDKSLPEKSTNERRILFEIEQLVKLYKASPDITRQGS